jgi:hypothetical protein
MRRRRLAIVVATLVVVTTVGGWLLLRQPFSQWQAGRPGERAKPAAPVTPSPTTAGPQGPSAGATVYLHYYLWWTPQHWHDKLGPGFPYVATAPPPPGRTDATGCNPEVFYPGSQLVDVPAEGLYDQGQAATFDAHISRASAAGVSGFLASWQGTGNSEQAPGSSGYNARLDLLVSRVDVFGRTHPHGFGLGLAFASFGDYQRPAAQVTADLRYFAARYGADPAFRNPYSTRPLVMWLDSRKYPAATVQEVSGAVRSQVYLVGDETASSWARDAPFLDATSYYWSSENPWQNSQAGANLSRLGAAVRASGKRWFAPFIAGYNKQLEGGSCVPRRGTDTLRQVWEVNSRSRPDAWFGISWNELVENTYLEPSRAYGSAYLDTLAALIRAR